MRKLELLVQLSSKAEPKANEFKLHNNICYRFSHKREFREILRIAEAYTVLRIKELIYRMQEINSEVVNFRVASGLISGLSEKTTEI